MAHLGRNKYPLTRQGLCAPEPSILDPGTIEDIKDLYGEVAHERSTPIVIEKFTNTKVDLFTGTNTAGQIITVSRAVKLPLVIEKLTGVTWAPYTTFTRVGQVITLTVAIPTTPANNIRVTYDIQEDSTYDEQTNKLYVPYSVLAIVTINPSPKTLFELGIRDQVDFIAKCAQQDLVDTFPTNYPNTDDRILFQGIRYSIYSVAKNDFVQDVAIDTLITGKTWSEVAPRTVP
jgi:hypothetical protein